MVSGLDPEKVKRVQQITKNILGEIRVDHDKKVITLAFHTTDESASKFLGRLLPQFSETLAAQLSAFFGIRGEIVDIRKK